MPRLPFAAFDSDNHYYEAEDAFTRHLDRRLRKRGVQWAVIEGRKRLLVADQVCHFIPNPTFDPVARPGSLDQYFRGKNPEGKSMIELFGELEPIHLEYRNRDARLKVMDEQGLEKILLFPTQGVGIEHPLRDDVEATQAVLRAFNRWLDEDWGFAWEDRLFAVPMISLCDLDAAVTELEWALGRGARMVHLRAAPVPGPAGTRSPGDPAFDPFWARVNEAGITVAVHAGDSGYQKQAAAWEPGRSGGMEAFRGYALGQVMLEGRSTYDMFAALIVHGVFARHPRVRVLSVENGSDWAAPLLKKVRKAFGQMPHVFAEPPLETFRRHVFVSPYYEDDVRALADLIETHNVVFGSDWPHAEGLADPVSFVDELQGFSDAEVRQVMRDNARGLVAPSPL
jgi:predicted TIM-barrel fold metal-dependent hydrolase